MATNPRRRDGEKDGGDGEPQRPGKHHGGDPVRIHEDFVQERTGGGAPATPENYGRAMEQFRRLPGAVRTPATEVTPPVQRRDRAKDDSREPDSGKL